jgi:predicted site-specific integrase-resolvase
MNRTLSPKEYAEILGVAQKKVTGWIAAGKIRAINITTTPDSSPPRWRITLDAIREFEASRMSVGAAP